VRRRLRAYVWAQGLALLVALLGAAFWIGLLLDWWFEPTPGVRRLAIGTVAAAGLYVIYHFLLRRTFVRVSDTSAALLLERRFAQLGDHVLTAVHVAHSPGRAATYHPELVANTNAAAAAAVANLNPGHLFDRRPLSRALLGAVIASVSIVAFAFLWSDAFGFWMKRIALANERWPRRVNLEVVGFPVDKDGRRSQRIAEEDDYELLVRARLTGYEAPRSVEIRTRTADGRRDSDMLIRVGQAVPGRDEFQLYRYEFKRITSDLAFDVFGGDDRVRDLRLEVVERPELFSLELTCEYPAYLKREPRRLAVTGGMRIPEGTRLVLHATSTKPLVASQIRRAQTEQSADISFVGDPTTALSWQYGPLVADDVLLVSVTDTDGVTSRNPYRISLALVPDETPQVGVRLRGIGTAITTDARIPLVGKITDEYGLKDAWFEYRVDGGEPRRRPLSEQPVGQPSITMDDAFDTREIDPATLTRALLLEPGQKLTLSLKATDEFDLSAEPRVGSSPQFHLDVVTLPQFLALLERRELELRQRYEAIYEKVTDTRNLLGRVEFNEAILNPDRPSDGAAENSANQSSPSTAAAQKNADEAALPAVSDADRDLARRRLRVVGALQNVTQSADEILGVAEAFEEIHEQLTNNRIDHPDLKARLLEQIAQPLRRIGQSRMPQLAAQVQLIERHIDDAAAGRPALQETLVLADAILIEMQQVLERMLELETYNEVVAQLREFITDQKELNRRTNELRREQLRKLFDQDK
jgi:hypothetical protein